MMHSDLTLEAMFRLRRRKSRESSVPQLQLAGLDAEHFDLALKAGWVTSRPAADARSTAFILTQAGEAFLDDLVAHSRLQALACSF